MSRYVVIEDSYPYPHLLADQYERTRVWTKETFAKKEAKNCRNGLVVKL